MVRAGCKSASFESASEDLLELAELDVDSERVRHACKRVGEDRIAQQDYLQLAHAAKSLPEQTSGKPAHLTAPQIAVVMCDGGRYQQLEGCRAKGRGKKTASARKGQHWKESRIGLLAQMQGQQYACDPQPQLPPELSYAAIANVLTEIGKTKAKLDDFTPDEAVQAANAEAQERLTSDILKTPEPLSSRKSEGLMGPELVCRSVVASCRTWNEFGPLLESQAWYRGFAAAGRKVFLSDGSATIEKLQRTHFSHYISVLDILHGLSYSLAAARAISPNEAAARQQYDQWAAMIWEGRVQEVIEELRVHAQCLGPPPENAKKDDPRVVLRMTVGYYENRASRMNYPSYRQQGFPLTSSLMESMVKQVSRRVKGSEKYWSRAGGEVMLRLRAEYLSDDEPMQAYWASRTRNANGTRTYRPRMLSLYN